MIKFRFPNNYIAITTYFSNKHTAIDIPYGVTCKNGKKNNVYCYAPCDMKIITNRWANDYGWFIEGQATDERGTWIIGCGHFKSQSTLKVGTNVKMGDIIGETGNTGTSNGEHNHYRLTLNGVRVDPLLYTYCYDDTQQVGTKETSNILHYMPIKITPSVVRDTTKNQVEVIKILRCRDIPSTSGNIIDEAQIGSIYNYYETRTADGYTWYRVADNQWLANNGTFLKIYIPIIEQPVVETPKAEEPVIEEEKDEDILNTNIPPIVDLEPIVDTLEESETNTQEVIKDPIKEVKNTLLDSIVLIFNKILELVKEVIKK